VRAVLGAAGCWAADGKNEEVNRRIKETIRIE
jgi:hypothetical protein